MATRASDAVFKIVELKDGSGWCVRLTLPNKTAPEIGDFKTQAEAKRWIKAQSAAWLRMYNAGAHA
jgi:hypothetical protein